MVTTQGPQTGRSNVGPTSDCPHLPYVTWDVIYPQMQHLGSELIAIAAPGKV